MSAVQSFELRVHTLFLEFKVAAFSPPTNLVNFPHLNVPPFSSSPQILPNSFSSKFPIFHTSQSSTILKSPSKPQCDFVVLRLILPPTNLVQFPQMPLKVPSRGTINQLSHIVSLIPRNPTSRLCSAASRQSLHLLPSFPQFLQAPISVLTELFLISSCVAQALNWTNRFSNILTPYFPKYCTSICVAISVYPVSIKHMCTVAQKPQTSQTNHKTLSIGNPCHWNDMYGSFFMPDIQSHPVCNQQ